MYNRYVRNDRGGYSRVPVDESPQEERNGGFPPPFQSAEGPSEGRGGQDHSDGPPPRHSGWETEEERRETAGLSGFLRRLLDRFHLEKVDSGDLLLMLILFLLWREGDQLDWVLLLGLALLFLRDSDP